MNNFETLQVLPSMEKIESGDYVYNQEFVGKIYYYNNTKNNTKELVYFYPNEKFIIPEVVFDAIVAKAISTNQALNQISGSKYLESSIFENQIGDMTSILNKITSTVNELGKRVSLSKDDILVLVRTELNMVKNNFENVMKSFITDEIKKQLDSSTRDVKGKLDPKVLIKLADNGFTPDHLIEMGKAGLI
jgi:hypothetical protein